MTPAHDAFATLRYRDFSIITLNQFCLTLAILIQEIIGALITMIAITKFPTMQHAWRNMLLAVAGFGLFTILFAFSHTLWLALFALTMTGACDSISVIIRQTILQIYPPENMRGRVAAVNGMFVSSSNELGAFESGLAAKYLGTITSSVMGGCITLAVVVSSWIKTTDLFQVDITQRYEDDKSKKT